jgi:hypothetical protein
MPKIFSDPEAIAEDIIRDVGTHLVVGLPLGLGKANHIANALYARAIADRGINLTFFSALTLEKPAPSNILERRFISPVIDRLFGGYPDLAYADALHAGELPPNVQVIEFFFLAGKWLHVPFAQQHYISANYTHASSYLLARGLNVVTQLVARRVVAAIPIPRWMCCAPARKAGPGSSWSVRSIRNCRSCRAPAICRRMNSAPCSRDPDANFRCLRRRPSRSAIPNTPSAFMPPVSSRTAARCRSASGRSGMRWRRA